MWNPRDVSKGDPIRADSWNEIVREVHRLSKLNVVPPLHLVNQPAGMPPLIALLDTQVGVWVEITGNAAGGGKYEGVILGHPTVTVSASGDLTADEVGDSTNGREVLIVNAREIGQDTHDLSVGDFFPGEITVTSEQGLPVVRINGAGRASVTALTAIRWNAAGDGGDGTLEYKDRIFYGEGAEDESAWTPFGDYFDCPEE